MLFIVASCLCTIEVLQRTWSTPWILGRLRWPGSVQGGSQHRGWGRGASAADGLLNPTSLDGHL